MGRDLLRHASRSIVQMKMFEVRGTWCIVPGLHKFWWSKTCLESLVIFPSQGSLSVGLEAARKLGRAPLARFMGSNGLDETQRPTSLRLNLHIDLHKFRGALRGNQCEFLKSILLAGKTTPDLYPHMCDDFACYFF